MNEFVDPTGAASPAADEGRDSRSGKLIDCASLLDRCVDNPSIVAKVLRAFVQSTPELMGRMAAAVEAEDLVAAGRCAHAIKGSTANISAEAASRTAAAIERRCADGAEATVRSDWLQLQVELYATLNEAEILMNQTSAMKDA